MPDNPALDLRTTDDPGGMTHLPIAVAERAGGVGIPARESKHAARYLLGDEIARGGMGAVHRATDTVLGREVAIKVLQVKYAIDSGTAGRFADEARITGQLQHPNIPAVHDLGILPDGRPFLAMKLIKGETLQDLLKRRADPTEERGRFVAAFEQVCQALAFAHAHDVIHRDLKPANIMVGAFGEVQVMDWGLAKVLANREREGPKADPEETRAPTAVRSLRESDGQNTGAGSVLGTPAFMPPEQAAGAVEMIDRRSDVFGLGAVLAVVLTGRPPFVAQTPESARVKAAQGDVSECFARLEACGSDPDLVAMCKHCLAPRPEDRPPDAGAVAKAVAALRQAADERARRAELDRVNAEGEAREAQARAAEQRRRRRLLLAASSIIGLVLLAGLSVSLWQMGRAIHAEEQANQNAQHASNEANAKAAALKAEQQARADETKARQQAYAALQTMTAEVVERKFAQGTVLTEDDRMFLRGIIAQFDAFAAIKANDADSRAVRAAGRLRVGLIRFRLGEFQEAEKHYDQALDIQKQLAAEFPSRSEFRQQLAKIHNNRGILLRDLGRHQEAKKDHDHALGICKQLTAEVPSQSEFRQLLAISYNNRVALLKDTGRLQEAEKDCEQALGIQKQLAAEFPSRPEFRHELAGSHYNRGSLLSATGRLQEAEKDFDQAMAIQKQLAIDFPSRSEFRQNLATSHDRRGNLLRATGRLQEAEKNIDQAMAIRKQLAADFPSRPDFREELAASHNNRGNLLSDTGRLQEAEKDPDQAIGIQKQLAADFPSRPEFRQLLAMSHNNRGNRLRESGRLQEAEKHYDQAVGIQKQLAAEFPSRPAFQQDLARSHANRGNLLIDTGRVQQAKKDYDQALRLRKQLATDFPSRPEFRQELAMSHVCRGGMLQATGRLPEAEKDYDQAVGIQKQLAAEFPSRSEFRRELARNHNYRGTLLRATGRLPEAEKDYNQALDIQKQLAAEFPSRPELRMELAGSHTNRGLLLSETGRPQEAEKDYDQAVDLQKKLAADFPTRPQLRQQLASSYNNRGNLLSDTGRLQEAEKDYDQALNIHKQLAADFPDQPDQRNYLAGMCVNQALLHREQGNPGAAKRLLLEGRPHHLAALKANPRHPDYRQFYRNHLSALTEVQAMLLEQDDAVRTAATRRDLGWDAPADAYDAACFLSRCIVLVARHDKLDDSQRQQAMRFYGDEAMKLLRAALSRGYRNVAHMQKDPDLVPMRPRQDFQNLIAELKEKGNY